MLLVETDGVAQCHAPLAEPDIFRLGDLDVRPVAAVGDPHQAGVAHLVVPQSDAPSTAAIGKNERHAPAGMSADVGHGHDQPVATDHHAAAPGDPDYRRPHLGHEGLDTIVQVLQLGQGGGAGDVGRSLLGCGRLGMEGMVARQCR